MIYNTTRETDNEYHGQSLFNGGPNLSSHALIAFIDNPAAFHAKKTGLMKSADSDAFRVGRAGHCRILEGKEAYQGRYVFGGPINEKTGKPFGQQTKAYEEWKSEREAEGKECLSDSDDALIEFTASGVSMHPEAMEALREGEAEAVARAKYCGVPCQIKADWLRQDAIIDLKTCRDLNRFEWDFKDYRYANQFSFYQKVFEAFAGVRLPVFCVAVEKAAPYRAAFYRIEQGVLDNAQLENEAAIQRIRECEATGLWLTGYEGVRVIEAR
jgi:hypothetical protein